MLIVTGVPGAQKAPLPETFRGPLSTNDVSPPGGRVEGAAARNVRGPPVDVETDHVRFPPEVTGQVVEQLTPVPALVPAKTTWQEVGVAHDMGVPPLFLSATEMAVGELEAVSPALRDAPTTSMLELAVALLMRL
jgi:hypothetical protein